MNFLGFLFSEVNRTKAFCKLQYTFSPMNISCREMANYMIRHIATSINGMRLATAEFEHTVQIWDLQYREKICEFQSILDFGGSRLAISENGSYCAAGAYNIYGIATYDAKNGNLTWQRKDLKQVQRLQYARHPENSLFAFFDDKPCSILNLENGETLGTVRGLRGMSEHPFAKIQLFEKSKEFEIFCLERSKRIVKIPRITFGALDITFTEDSVIISESAGPVSSYSISNGKLNWQYLPDEGNHVLKLAYCSGTDEILGISWPYKKGGDKTIFSFEKGSGKINHKLLIKNSPEETEFALNGTRLICSDGTVIDTSDGNILFALY
jgi:WD40 repeat protein